MKLPMGGLTMQMTYAIAHAAAWDAGNRSMSAHGRTAWNEEDWNAMVEQFERLWPVEDQCPAPTV